jgi:hypothetical protein
MSTIKSSAENLTLNADGANNDVIIQSNGSTKVTVDGATGAVGIGTTTMYGKTNSIPKSGFNAGGTTWAETAYTAAGIYGGGYSLIDGSAGYLLHAQDAGATFIIRQGTVGSAPTERIRIDPDGLKFNGDTAAANALDDYEEGTWTPTDNSGAGMTLTVWEAFYTKIGRKVYIEIGFLIPSNSSSAVVSIGGLPYTSKSGNDNTGGFTLTGSNAGRLDYWLVNRGYTKFGASTYNNVGAPNSSYSNKQIKLCGSYTTA